MNPPAIYKLHRIFVQIYDKSDEYNRIQSLMEREITESFS